MELDSELVFAQIFQDAQIFQTLFFSFCYILNSEEQSQYTMLCTLQHIFVFFYSLHDWQPVFDPLPLTPHWLSVWLTSLANILAKPFYFQSAIAEPAENLNLN